MCKKHARANTVLIEQSRKRRFVVFLSPSGVDVFRLVAIIWSSFCGVFTESESIYTWSSLSHSHSDFRVQLIVRLRAAKTLWKNHFIWIEQFHIRQSLYAIICHEENVCLLPHQIKICIMKQTITIYVTTVDGIKTICDLNSWTKLLARLIEWTLVFLFIGSFSNYCSTWKPTLYVLSVLNKVFNDVESREHFEEHKQQLFVLFQCNMFKLPF
jgi:hypothetical protein